MPRKEAISSFDAAAKHLFRHLHEPRALERNPILRRFFEGSTATDVDRVRAERAGLERVHRLLRRAAERFRDHDAAGGESLRAFRQYTIVTQQCFERRPLREVAGALGISPQHCYRERAAICRRLARYLADCDDAPVTNHLPKLDPFQFLVDRARLAATRSDRAAAFDECDALVSAAPSPPQKIEALRISGAISGEMGDLDRAQEAHTAALHLRDEFSDRERESWFDVASGSIALLGSDLAYSRADTAGALREAKKAVAHLERAAETGEPYVNELYVEGLWQLGATFWNFGELGASYEAIGLANTNLHRVRAQSFPLRARVINSLWKLRNHSLISSESWYPLAQRLEGLAKGFELASISGALLDGRDSLIAMVQCHAFAGNDDEALEVARFTLTFVGRHPSETVRVHVRVQLAMVLLSTRYWEYGLALVESQPLDLCDGYHRALVAYLNLERALRRGAYERAVYLLGEGSEADRYPALVVRRQLAAAAVASALQRERDARALIEATLPAAEDLGSALILRDACRLAAKITGDRRFKEQASDLARPSLS